MRHFQKRIRRSFCLMEICFYTRGRSCLIYDVDYKYRTEPDPEIVDNYRLKNYPHGKRHKAFVMKILKI